MAEPNWKKAQSKVSDALKAFEVTRKDFWTKRFTDTYEAGGKIVQNQPSDQWCLYQGLYHLVEVKSSEYPGKFYFKDIRPSQFIGARRVTAAGGKSIFVIAKLPEWQWYRADGMLLWTRHESGDAGILWSDLQAIKLSAATILGI